MKKTLKLSFAIALFCSFTAKSQNYIVKKDGDTIHCYNIEWSTNSQGFIVDLSYMDNKTKKPVELHKRKNIPPIASIKDGMRIYDVMPLKTSKPDSYYRVGNRVVDGILKVSLFNSLHE